METLIGTRADRIQAATRARPRGLAAFSLGLLAVFVLAACGGRERGGVQGVEVYRFSSLPEMVATADLVVLGSVEEAGKYREVGPPEEEIRYSEVTLRVEKVLKGSSDRTLLKLDSLELADYSTDWRREGIRIVAFINEDRGTGVYFPVNSQSIFVIEGRDVEPTSVDSFTTSVGALSFVELERKIEDAKARIARGEVRPAKPVWER